jgi:hypothetical protein
VGVNGKWGYVGNPLTMQQQMDVLEGAGVIVGSVKEIAGNEVIVAGSSAIQTVRMFDKLCTFAEGKIIILNAYFPMLTIVKCKVISGNSASIAKGAKVYKYTGGKKRRIE